MTLYLVSQRTAARRLLQPVSPITNRIKPGAQITPQGLAFLCRFEPIPAHAKQSLREIERAVWRQVLVPLSANQFAALVSFTYSIGEAALSNSRLLRQLNLRRYQAAAAEFCADLRSACLSHSDSVLAHQLASRRKAEQKLFLRR
ncbi:MAG: glycoside hydrolase family protein [Pegethrix bostrychoides GSE-TBD4-15B]|uniref:Lysozyme n=1 Tax=Pegethrix bostrychoides GSE-TBD4-15B TaxID=2839662 RepID=A0A951PER4_9CYAN|nr:glycoside hydrolase family protein [Pegethrix bostrychoides GSE-TBD4-15B]